MASRKDRTEEELKDKKPEAKETPTLKADDDGVIEIELASDSEEEGDEAGEAAEPEAKPSRRERRNQRGFDEFKRRAEAAELRAQQLEQQQQAYLAQQQAQAAQQHSQQQLNQEEERLYRDLQNFHTSLEAKRGTATEAEMQEFQRQAKELEERKFRVYAHKHGMGQQVDPRQIAAHVEQVQLQAKYADIFANPAARNWGEGRVLSLAAERGLNAANITRAQYYEILEEAAEETRHRFALGGQRRPPPDAATKARTTGLPARASGNGGSAPVTTIKMGPAERKMAKAMYPKMPEHLAYRQWATMRQKRAAQKER